MWRRPCSIFAAPSRRGAVLVALILIDVLFVPPKWQIKLEEYQKRRPCWSISAGFCVADARAQKAEARRQLR